MSSAANMRKLYRQLAQQGFRITKTGGGHTRIEHPNMVGPVYAPTTPSDGRSWLNVKAAIKRNMRGELANG